MNEKFLNILGWVATFMAVMMYVSYIPQISGNLNGQKGDFIQPLVAGINCSLWVAYGFSKKRETGLSSWLISLVSSSDLQLPSLRCKSFLSLLSNKYKFILISS